MRRIIKAFMQDASTASKFQFSLRCAVCGSLWKSRPAYFSKAEVQPENEGKHVIFQALYQRERDDARERAVTEALEHFSRCPICRRLACDRCFLLRSPCPTASGRTHKQRCKKGRKSTMKKMLSLVLSLLIVFSLTACGGGDGGSGGGKKDSGLPGIDMKSTEVQTVSADRATLDVLNETFFTYLGGLNYFSDDDEQSKLTYADLKEHIGVDCSDCATRS